MKETKPKNTAKGKVIIALTGTPAVGKSTVLRELEKKGFEAFDLNKIINENKLYVSYDRKSQTRDVDINVLSRFVEKEIIANSGERIVLDSHLSHHLSPDIISLCVVLKCELKELRSRLEKRNYSKKKVRENLDCEIFDVCLVEALEKGHEVLTIDSTLEQPNRIADKICGHLKKKLH